MEILTASIILIGLLTIIITLVHIYFVFALKPFIRSWIDHLRYNKNKLILLISLLLIGILFVSPYYMCNNYGKKIETITSYKLISKDDTYISNNYNNDVTVYVRGSAENSIEELYIKNPIYIITNDKVSTYDKITITNKWWIFEINDYENRIYLNEY